MFHRILVPTDGSEAAATAASVAIALADRFDAAVHAVHVVDLSDVPSSVQSDATTELQRQGEAAVESVADRAADTDVPVTTRVLESPRPVHEELLDYVADEGVDLVVMGTHGRTGLARIVLGSVTERLLRVSPVPVLTVHEDSGLDTAPESVLVPTDGSDAANAAADRAVALAAATGAGLQVVYVVDPTAAAGEYGSADVLEALEMAGQRAVGDVVARAEDAGVGTIEASVLGGATARAILDYAADRDVDLVAMGTHGRTGLERYLLGSVTEKVVRVAEMPVLTVSAHDEE
ncbi:universal stress protein [Halobacterium wangiae]|uniref:universal stress protein n=1 Tax=Halobacterium wangiae TaxID=2902623 RepID=UPI001E5FE6B3|nr:universal stress protein [Halobacterium wangiae]